MAELRTERDRGLGQPSDAIRPLERRRAAEILVRKLDALVIAVGEGLLERPGEILVRPGAQVDGERARAGDGVQALAGVQPGDLERELLAPPVKLRDPQRLVRERESRRCDLPAGASPACAARPVA